MILFISYASADLGGDRLKQFFVDLVEKVRELSGRAPKHLAFIDRESVEVGLKWEPQIAAALSTAPVFLPILSPTYVNSRYCGQEWQVFAKRMALVPHPPGKASPLQPVLWTPFNVSHNPVPDVVKEVQQYCARDGEEYGKNGLSNLARFPAERPYLDVVNAIAARIAEASQDSVLPPMDPLPDLAKVQPLFPVEREGDPDENGGGNAADEPGGPEYAKFIFFTAYRSELEKVGVKDLKPDISTFPRESRPRGEWLPFPRTNPGLKISLTAQEMASRNSLEFGQINFKLAPKVLRDILDKPEYENTPVVVVVEPWTLKLQTYLNEVAFLGKWMSVNSVVLAVWNMSIPGASAAQAELETLIWKTFAGRFPGQSTLPVEFSISSHEELRVALNQTLAVLKNRMISTMNPRVLNLDRTSVETMPTVAGQRGAAGT